MKAFCEEVLHFTEDAAYKGIQAARKAREFPELFEALADGRLNLTAICLLAPHLTLENAAEWIAAATHRRKAEITGWLDRRFPAPQLALAPGQVAAIAAEVIPKQIAVVGGEPVALLEPESLPSPLAPAQVVKTDWMDLRIKARKSKLQYARELASAAFPNGDASLIFDRAIDLFIRHYEKKKFGATARPGKPRPSRNPRHIPAHMRRAVWESGGGQCAIVGDNGKRCGTREFLEFDHIVPLARGGTTTVENLRLVCRAHNQWAADRALGAGFMQKKREERLKAPSHRDDVIKGLRSHGVSARQAPIVVGRSGAPHQPTLEESMRAALKCLGPRKRTISAG
jgi:5-methylcytosine-specific restriction endonuclease McrA